jgi:hypothetical protein
MAALSRLNTDLHLALVLGMRERGETFSGASSPSDLKVTIMAALRVHTRLQVHCPKEPPHVIRLVAKEHETLPTDQYWNRRRKIINDR